VPVNRGYNYEKAKRFGELVFVTEGDLNPFDVSLMRKLWKIALEKSTSEDYIIVTSLASHLAVGSALFGEKHKCLNLLLFSHGDYISQTIQVGD
jgi:hypothetical protein